MRILLLTAVAVAAASVGSAAPAPRTNPAAVMRERHEGMEAIGKQFKALHREFDSTSPNLGAVRASAASIANLARRASGWFAGGTGPERGKTGAKADIWLPANKADFAAKLGTFQRSAGTLAAVARGNDVGGMKAAYATLGGACKACHDKYRAEMKH